jgi:hypothetical protein
MQVMYRPISLQATKQASNFHNSNSLELIQATSKLNHAAAHNRTEWFGSVPYSLLY